MGLAAAQLQSSQVGPVQAGRVGKEEAGRQGGRTQGEVSGGMYGGGLGDIGTVLDRSGDGPMYHVVDRWGGSVIMGWANTLAMPRYEEFSKEIFLES